MIKTLFLCAVLIGAVAARENPFFTTDEAGKLPVTSNIPDSRPKLTSIPYSFPNQARILKEVSFTIQNVDGSIETHKMKIDQSIDWHSPLIISQSSRSVSPVTTDKTPDLSKSSVADFGFIRFNTNGKILTIKSDDAIIRHFALTDPNQIIIDFKRSAIFEKKEKILNTPPYTSVSIGNHGKFVRATIILDGRYDYTLSKGAGIISITCK